MRQEFELSQQQLDRILGASKPVPYIAVQCGEPSSPQENANRAWQSVALELGFVWDSAEPVRSKGDRFITAEAIHQTLPPCKGKNCGCTDGRSHSPECLAEYEIATKIPDAPYEDIFGGNNPEHDKRFAEENMPDPARGIKKSEASPKHAYAHLDASNILKRIVEHDPAEANQPAPEPIVQPDPKVTPPMTCDCCHGKLPCAAHGSPAPETTDPEVAPRKKCNYVGAPAIFALETACRQLTEAFGGWGCYLVGSSLDRPDWRDVDVRFIMSDEQFATEFPGAGRCWEQDAKWLLLTVAISERLSKITGLPIDFQIQPRTYANERHRGSRIALGMHIGKEETR